MQDPTMQLEDLPPYLLTFPRGDYSHACVLGRKLQGVHDACVGFVLRDGARRATRAWSTAQRTGKWALVDQRCFYLAVLDKVDEIKCERRRWCLDYSDQLWNRRPAPIWPVLGSTSRWFTFMDSLILIAYKLALDVYPSHRAAPSLESVRAVVTPLSRWLHEFMIGTRYYSFSSRPRIDVKAVLGQFAPRSDSKAIDSLTKPLSRLSLSHDTRPQDELSQRMGRLNM
ncbi:unnamed protein product [Cutaneotrichosporon oleaginosum]